MVPFIDLKRQYHAIKEEIDAAIRKTLESTQFILGSEVAAFEKDFAAYCGADEGVGVSSGTSALHLALLAAGVGPGDEVITVPMTFVATVAAIGYCGAKPVFVDVDPATYTMDPEQIESAITPRTKAILPVHLYGQPADMDPIMRIARHHGLAVVEDAAQAHGAEYKGRRVGGIGDLGCFSFYPGKNLGAYGEGGAVVTGNPAFAHKIRTLRDWGQEGKYNHVLRGFNYRLEGLQGAILRVKLRYLERWTEARRANAAHYNRLLAGSGLFLPAASRDRRHVYHVYAVLSDRRSELQDLLNSRDVQTGIHYPCPVHLLPAWKDLGYRKGMFPVAEMVAARELSLPMFPELTVDQMEQVADVVNKFQAVSRHEWALV
jgi:dTDP-4-amino-4,6-dideoxygalactose transaminase